MIAEADRPTPVPIPNSLSPFESGYAKLIVTPPEMNAPEKEELKLLPEMAFLKSAVFQLLVSVWYFPVVTPALAPNVMPPPMV